MEDCRRIERETREQGNSQAWYFERSKQLTASIFGRIVRRRENIFPKSIIEQIGKGIETRKLKTAALQWGIDNEKVALAKYKQEFSESYQVIECGLMINPKWPWLGASPDGLLAQDGTLVGGVEIKCPFTKRDMMISDACNDKTFFMADTTSGPKLKESHPYYYQCQGVMNIVGLSWIDFIVYTEKDLFVQRLTRDTFMWQNAMLPKLVNFYKNFVLEQKK